MTTGRRKNSIIIRYIAEEDTKNRRKMSCPSVNTSSVILKGRTLLEPWSSLTSSKFVRLGSFRVLERYVTSSGLVSIFTSW